MLPRKGGGGTLDLHGWLNWGKNQNQKNPWPKLNPPKNSMPNFQASRRDKKFTKAKGSLSDHIKTWVTNWSNEKWLQNWSVGLHPGTLCRLFIWKWCNIMHQILKQMQNKFGFTLFVELCSWDTQELWWILRLFWKTPKKSLLKSSSQKDTVKRPVSDTQNVKPRWLLTREGRLRELRPCRAKILPY